MTLRDEQDDHTKSRAKRAVLLFLISIASVVFPATAISDSVGLISHTVLPRSSSCSP